MESLEQRRLLAVLLSTDESVYYGDQIVSVQANGFEPGETMQFQILHADGKSNEGPGHAPVLIADGGANDEDGVANGAIAVSAGVDPSDSAGSTFDLIGTRISTGETAVVSFHFAEPTPPGPTSTWVLTDKDDYLPGETAVIDAHGFQPGEAVEFQVLHVDGKPNSGGGHTAWQVVDGSPEDVDGAIDGNVRTNWYVDPDDSLNSVFSLTAAGQTSDAIARDEFTDHTLGTETLFSDSFESGFSSKWDSSKLDALRSYDVDHVHGPATPPYGSYAAELDGDREFLWSDPINLSNYLSGSLYYSVQAGGHEDMPEDGDDLRVEYYAADGQWKLLRSEDASSFSSYADWDRNHAHLPSDAFHSGFRFRFNASSSDSGYYFGAYDDWFIDLVRLYGLPNSAPTVSVSTPHSGVQKDGDTPLGHSHYFNWSASDVDGNLSSKIAILQRKEGSVWNEVRRATSGSRVYQYFSDGLGEYRLKVVGKDAKGATTTRYSDVINFKDDDVSPPTIHASAPESTSLAADSQEFSWEIRDDSGHTFDVTVAKNGTEIYAQTAESASGLSLGSFNFDAYGVGRYTLSITATDSDNDRSNDQLTSSETADINVINGTPTASFAIMADQSERLEGSLLTFDAGGSTDPEGDVLQYVWNFGDGSLARGEQVSHAYADNGDYDVTLTVVDNFGGIAKTTQAFGIGNVAPQLTATAPTVAVEASPFVLHLAAADPGRDSHTYVVHWGDGFIESFATPGEKEHLYADGGADATVRVDVYDEDGAYEGLYSRSVSVENAAPIIEGLPSFDSAQAGLAMQWDATVLDGAGDTHVFSWDFGDGTTLAGSEYSRVSHAYGADGVYEAVLTVTDSDGLTSQHSIPVVIGAPVTLSSAGQVVSEGAGSLTFAAELSNGVALDHEVRIQLEAFGDVDSHDFELPLAEIVIPAGETFGQVNFSIVDDALDENAEVLRLRARSASGASLGAVVEHVVTIEDNDESPLAFFITPSRSISEGFGEVELVAGLSEVSGREVTIPVTFGGVAERVTDFQTTNPPQIVIPAGTASASIRLSIINDDAIEPAEPLLVGLGASEQARLAEKIDQPTTLSLIIEPSDAPDVSLDSAYRITTEDASTFFITARLSRFTDEIISVPFDVGGTAENGVDYRIVSGLLEFPPGASEASIQVNLVDDDITESVETLEIQLQSATNANLGATQLTVTEILDNDVTRVSFEPGSISEWEGNVVPVKVKLSTPSAVDVTVPIKVTATASGSEFVLDTTELVIASGDDEGTLHVTLLDDNVNEPTESVYLSLEDASGAFLGDHLTKSIAIKDNDPFVRLESAVRSIGEGFGAVEMTASLSGLTDHDVTVPLNYSGTARRNSDYTGPSSITIPSGSTSAAVQLRLSNDSAIESSETIIVSLGAASGGTTGTPKSAQAIVLDDDTPTVSWDTGYRRVAEESGIVRLTVNLSQTPSADVRMSFKFAANGASGGDYTGITQSLVIPAGQRSGQLSFRLLNDEIKESTEYVSFTMTSAGNAYLPSDPSSRKTKVAITDRDKYTALEMANLTQNVRDGGFFLTEGSAKDAYKANEGFYSGVDLLLQVASVAANALGPWAPVAKVPIWTTQWLREEYPLWHWIDAPVAAEDADFDGDWILKEQFWEEWTVEMGKQFALYVGGSLLGDLLSNSIDWSTSVLDITVRGGDIVAGAIVAAGDYIGENVTWSDVEREAGNVYQEVKSWSVKSIFGGYGDGMTLFLDLDFNGIRTANEPMGITSPDGLALIDGVADGDVDGNGILDFDEGQWVASGGVDTSVGREFKIPFVAPANFSMLTPSSTLVSKLVDIGAFERTGAGVRDADTRYMEALGLTPRPLAQFDFVRAAARGDDEAAELFAKETQIYNTVVMAASLFEGRTGLPFNTLANIALEDIASKIASPDSSLDLGRSIIVESLFRGVAVRTGSVWTDEEFNTATEAVVLANQAIAKLPVEGSEAYLEQVAKVHHVAQGEYLSTLRQFGGGEIDAAQLLVARDGFDSSVALAPSFNVLPVYLAASSTTVVEGDTGETYLEFAVTPFGVSAVPMSVEFRTGDGTALAGDDYVAAAGTLNWEVGESKTKTIRVPVLPDDSVESDETVSLFLSNSKGAAILSGTATGTVSNDDVFSYQTTGESESLVLSASASELILVSGGNPVYDGSFGSGGSVQLLGRASDSLRLFSDANEMVHNIALDGSESFEIFGHTVFVSGVSTTGNGLSPEVAGIPDYLFEEGAVGLSTSAPAAINPDTVTYRWNVYREDSASPIELGSTAAVSYLPMQGDNLLELIVSDGVRTRTAKYEIFVYPPNVPPVAHDDVASTDENSSVALDVIANDTDLNPQDTLTLVAGSATLASMSRKSDGSAIAAATSRIAENGNSISFDPETDFDFLAADEMATVLIGYTVTDDNVVLLTDAGVLTLTINGVNDNPSLTTAADSVRIDEGEIARNSGFFYDIDFSDDVAITASVGHITQVAGSSGSWAWEFTAADNAASTEVVITADDGNGGVVTARFDLTIDNVRPSLAVVETQSISEGTVLVLERLGQFTDPGFNNPGNPLVVGGSRESFEYTVDWGDGTSTGIVSAIDVISGGIDILTSGFFGASHTYADNGAYTVTVRLRDDDMLENEWVEKQFTVSVSNVAPTLAALPDLSTLEGSFIELPPAEFSDPGFELAAAAKKEDFHASIDWGDGTVEPIDHIELVERGGEAGVLTRGTIQARHAYADNGTYTVTVRVRDDDMVNDGVEQWIVQQFTATIDNAAPTITSFTGSSLNLNASGTPVPLSGVRGQTLYFDGSFSDPGFNNPLHSHEVSENFEFHIDWGDGTYETAVAPSASGAEGVLTTGSFFGSHIYAAEGTYGITVTVSDDDTGVAKEVYQSTVSIVAMQAGGDLAVGGDALLADNLRFEPGPNASEIAVTLNGVGLGTYVPTGRLLVFGQDGDDDLRAAGSLHNPTVLYGDAGNDRLKGGAGDDVLFGGDGDDLLVGSSGRDLMIGGTGSDRLVGNADDDILVAGSTVYDEHAAAISALMAEWTGKQNEDGSVRTFEQRRMAINGGASDGLNGQYYLRATDLTDSSGTVLKQATVLDDGTDRDVLTGSAGDDWFFLNQDFDKATDLTDEAFANDLDFISS